MALIDRRIDRLTALDARAQKTRNCTEWVDLVQESYALREGFRAEMAQVNRLAAGWAYLPPPVRKP